MPNQTAPIIPTFDRSLVLSDPKAKNQVIADLRTLRESRGWGILLNLMEEAVQEFTEYCMDPPLDTEGKENKELIAKCRSQTKTYKQLQNWPNRLIAELQDESVTTPKDYDPFN